MSNLPTSLHRVLGLGSQASRLDACMSSSSDRTLPAFLIPIQDKQAVEAYKADIKAQLTRAGLIRGQPRSRSIRHSPTATHTQPRPAPYHSPSLPNPTPPTHHFDHSDRYNYLDLLQRQRQNPDHHMIPGMPSECILSRHPYCHEPFF